MGNWQVYYNRNAAPSACKNLSNALVFLNIFGDALFVQRIKWPRIKIKRHSLVHKILMVLKSR